MQHLKLLFLVITTHFAIADLAQERVSPATQVSPKDLIEACLQHIQKLTETQPDSAIYYCNKGFRMAEMENDRKAQGAFLLALGHVHFTLHHTWLSRRFVNDAMSIFTSIRYDDGIAQAYSELALLDGLEKNENIAMQELQKARTYFNKADDSSGAVEVDYSVGEVSEEAGDTTK